LTTKPFCLRYRSLKKYNDKTKKKVALQDSVTPPRNRVLFWGSSLSTQLPTRKTGLGEGFVPPPPELPPWKRIKGEGGYHRRERTLEPLYDSF
jgi:hypothetical protein